LKYWAFLSYSHQDNLETRQDGKRGCIRWAEWLHDGLETYSVPADFRSRATATGEPMPERFFPVFQDEKELPINANLGESIRTALEQSRFLIVICSPRSASSRYVNEEVRHFKALGRQDRIMTLMIDGEPNASFGNKDGYPRADECFCPALRHPLSTSGEIDPTRSDAQEPIAGDVRVKDAGRVREATARDLPAHEPVLEYMRLKLIAGLMRVGFDELAQRDKARAIEEARTKARRARRIALVVGGLAFLAIGAALFAFQQKKTAQRETQRALNAEQTAKEKTAEVVRNLSRADFIAADEAMKAGLSQQALARLARAVRGDPNNLAAGRRLLFLLLQQPWFVRAPEGEKRTDLSSAPPDPNAAARRASTEDMARKRLGKDRTQAIVAISDSGNAAAIARSGGKIEWLDNSPESEERSPVDPIDLGFPIKALAFSPDEERLVAVGGYQDEYGHHGEVAVIPKIQSHAKTNRMDRGPIEAVAFSPDDRLLVAGGAWWDADGHLLGNFLAKDETNIRFSADGRTVAMGEMLWTQVGRQPISKEVNEDASDGPMALDGEYSPDGSHVVSQKENDAASLIDLGSGRAAPLRDSKGFRFVFTSDSRRLAGVNHDRGGGLTWDVATAKVIGRFPTAADSWLLAASNELVIISSSKEAVIWNLEKNVQTGAPIAERITAAAFHPDGKRLLLIGEDKSARLWDIAKEAWISESISLPDTNNEARFGPDGSCFATSSCDGGAGLGSFQLWDTETMRPLSKPVVGSGIFGESGEIAPLGSFRFTPRWQLFLSAGPPEGTEQMAQYLSFDLPHSGEPVAGWMPDLAEAVAGLRLTANGVFLEIDASTRSKTVSAVRTTTERGEDTWSATIRWWLDESAARRISPRSSVTAQAYVERRLGSTEIHDLVLAGRAAPENHDVFARLAAVAAKQEYATGIALSASRRARWFATKPASTSPQFDPISPQLQARRATLSSLAAKRCGKVRVFRRIPLKPGGGISERQKWGMQAHCIGWAFCMLWARECRRMT